MILVSNYRLGCVLFKIKQQAFVLFFIKRREFFLGGGTWYVLLRFEHKNDVTTILKVLYKAFVKFGYSREVILCSKCIKI